MSSKMPPLQELRRIMHQSSKSELTNWHDPFLLMPLLFSALLAIGFVVLAALRLIKGLINIHYFYAFVLLTFVTVIAYLIYMIRETIKEAIRYTKEGGPDLLDLIDKQHQEQNILKVELTKVSTKGLEEDEQDLLFQIEIYQESLDTTRLRLKGLSGLAALTIAITTYFGDKVNLHVPVQMIFLICAAIAATFFFSLLSLLLVSRTRQELRRILHVLRKVLRSRESE